MQKKNWNGLKSNFFWVKKGNIKIHTLNSGKQLEYPAFCEGKKKWNNSKYTTHLKIQLEITKRLEICQICTKNLVLEH